VADFTASSDAAQLAAALAVAADELADLEPVNRQAGALILARGGPAVPRRSGALAASLQADVTSGGVTIASHLPYHYRADWPIREATAELVTELAELYRDHAVNAVQEVTT
jgi:hypothetical protein